MSNDSNSASVKDVGDMLQRTLLALEEAVDTGAGEEVLGTLIASLAADVEKGLNSALGASLEVMRSRWNRGQGKELFETLSGMVAPWVLIRLYLQAHLTPPWQRDPKLLVLRMQSLAERMFADAE